MAADTKMLQAVERRCIRRSLEPLTHMSEAMRRDFVSDLGLAPSSSREAVVDALAGVVLATPRSERDATILLLLRDFSTTQASDMGAGSATFGGRALDVQGQPLSRSADPSPPPPSYAVAVQLEGSQAFQETSLTEPYDDAARDFALESTPANITVTSPRSTTDGATGGLPPPPYVHSSACDSSPNYSRSCCSRVPPAAVAWLLIFFSLAPIQFGLTTLLAIDHTRLHTQVFAGVTGGFFFWPLYFFASYGLRRLWCSNKRWTTKNLDTTAGVCIVVAVLAGLALSLPICILFGSGVQGTLYYKLMKIEEGVYLRDIPLESDVLAYRTLDGEYVPSTFSYTTIPPIEDSNPSNGYSVRIAPNASFPTAFPIFATYSDSAPARGTFPVVFNNGVFEHWLVRLDCARDDNCPVIHQAVEQSTSGTYLAMRDKNPNDRLDHYYGEMIKTVIAAAVFYAFVLLAGLILFRDTLRNSTVDLTL
jgi:hypothetical protein